MGVEKKGVAISRAVCLRECPLRRVSTVVSGEFHGTLMFLV